MQFRRILADARYFITLSDASNPAHGWSRLDGVDLLRGLAIFFVLMNHVNMRLLIGRIPYVDGLPRQLVDSLVWNGQSGVQIFFAVSGFLITAMSLRRWGALPRVDPRGFYAMRFARIAPLLLLLLAVLTTLHFARLQDFTVSEKTGGLGRALFAALTLHVNVLEARRGYLPANWDILWSLSVEELFYLFFPIVCRLLGRSKLLLPLLAGLVVMGPLARTILAHGNEVWREYSYFGSMDAIALGCLTALVTSQYRFSRVTLRVLTIAGSALLLFTLCFSLQAERLGLERTGLHMTVLALGSCMLIAAAAQTNWKSPRILGPLLQLGRRSYEVYLTHLFVVFALFHLFLFAGKPIPAIPVLFLATILFAGFFGELVARYYSEPLNRAIRSRWLGKADT
jgi:peptidoglycan/LPS O-acetylase OafA/YrhL